MINYCLWFLVKCVGDLTHGGIHALSWAPGMGMSKIVLFGEYHDDEDGKWFRLVHYTTQEDGAPTWCPATILDQAEGDDTTYVEVVPCDGDNVRPWCIRIDELSLRWTIHPADESTTDMVPRHAGKCFIWTGDVPIPGQPHS